MLAASSSRRTVHVFNIAEAEKERQNKLEIAEAATTMTTTSINNTTNNHSSSSSLSSSQKIKQRWYDGILSNIKKTKDDETKDHQIIIRSIAKIKCEKPVIPNTIAMLPTKSYGMSSSDEEEEEGEELVAICFENGKLLVYAIPKNSSSRRKSRPRPVLADDIMFDSESALAS